MVEEEVTRAKCYMKGEESNIEKMVHNVKERVPNVEDSHHKRNNNYTSPINDKTAFKRVGEATENITLLNTLREQIWHEVFHLQNIPTLSSPKENVMGPEPKRWYKLYRVKRHHAKD